MSAPRIEMVGKKFGRLTVTAYAGEANCTGERHRWTCACDCGTAEFVARGNSLRSGKTKSCGCLQRETAQKNKGRDPLELTGQVFGKLSVVEKAGRDQYGRVLWRCACACGQEAVTAGRNLVAGFTKSCGCYRRERAPTIQPGRTRCFPGATFGLLTLSETTGRRGGDVLWRCACSCGGEKVVTGAALRRGDAKSCGCLRVGRKPKAEKAKPPKAVKATAPKATRMSIKPERRTADGSIGAWPKTAPKAKAAPADSRPAWRPRSEYKPTTAPAERATGPLVRVLPGWTHDPRYQLAPGERVLGGFATAGIGRYIEGVAA